MMWLLLPFMENDISNGECERIAVDCSLEATAKTNKGYIEILKRKVDPSSSEHFEFRHLVRTF